MKNVPRGPGRFSNTEFRILKKSLNFLKAADQEKIFSWKVQ